MTATITTREVTIASHDGKSFSAYLAVPASGHGPGLVPVSYTHLDVYKRQQLDIK